MFRSSRLGSLIAVVGAALASAFQSFCTATDSFVQACKRLAVHFVEKVARADAVPLRPAVAMVQAKAFVQRIIKRERPVTTASWRMCPSV